MPPGTSSRSTSWRAFTAWSRSARRWVADGAGDLEPIPMRRIRGTIGGAAAVRTRPGALACALWLAASCAGLVPIAGCQQAPSASQAQKEAAEKKEEGNAADAEGVTLKPEEIEKAGIKTTLAVASHHAVEVGGYALVITREAIAQAVADVSEWERLLAWAPVGAPQPGVVIPSGAVLINGGKYWCYVEEKPGRFVRKEIDPGMPTDEGYFVKENVAAGAKIVTESAGELLARELGTAAAE